MANKLDAVLDNITTALTELVDATLKVVTRDVVNPLKVRNVPCLGLVPVDVRRADQVWIATALLMLCARKGAGDADANVTDLIAEVDAKITALIDAGTAGGRIDQPAWDFWYHAGADQPLKPVGAIGRLRISFENPLKTA